jgi:HSP20 family protein
MVLRFDPFRDIDRFVEQLGRSGGGPRSFPMDAYRRGDAVTVHLDLPGVNPESIDLTAESDVLTIKAERTFPREDGDEMIVQERPQGSFTRQLMLGSTLDAENLHASYDQGVLTITIPISERAKPRRIRIGAAQGQPRTIEGEASEAGGGRFQRSEQPGETRTGA